MTLTLSPEGQLIAGLIVLLTPQLADLIPATNIIPGWEDRNLMVSLSNQPNSALVVISLEKSKTSKIVANSQSARNRQSKTVDANGNVTLLNEVLREDVPVRFIVQCNGPSGRYKRNIIASRIKSILGAAYDLPIPDSIEDIDLGNPANSLVDPAYTQFQLTNRLIFVGGFPVDNDDEAQEYRYDVLYTASVSNYKALVCPLVSIVDTTTVIG